MSSDVVEPTPSTAAAAKDSPDDLILAAKALFGGDVNYLKLKSKAGKPVVLKPSTMAQLPVLMRFFTAVIKSMDAQSIATLVRLLSGAQQRQIAKGLDPNAIDVAPGGDVEGFMKDSSTAKLMDYAGLLTQVMTAGLEQLPELAEAYTTLSAEEYELLPPDEGMIIAGGVFLMNYHFFTQRLLPIFAAFMKSQAALALPETPQETGQGKQQSVAAAVKKVVRTRARN